MPRLYISMVCISSVDARHFQPIHHFMLVFCEALINVNNQFRAYFLKFACLERCKLFSVLLLKPKMMHQFKSHLIIKKYLSICSSAKKDNLLSTYQLNNTEHCI